MRKEGRERRVKRRFAGSAAVAATVAVVLGGCSSVPNAVNPVKWYENTVDYFKGDKEKKAEAQAQTEKSQAPGADQAFPNLGTVPEKPKVSAAEEKRQIAQGLVGDREGRRYAPEVTRQGAPTHVLGSETPSGAAAATSATPTPVPSLPVASAPAAPPRPVAPAPMVQAPAPLMPSAPPPTLSAAPPPPQLTGGAPAPATRAPATAVPSRSTQPVGPAFASSPAAPDAFETVVVSSSGVDEMAARPVAAAPSSRSLAPTRGAGPAAADRSGSLKVATIQFSNGSADLEARDRAILRDVVALQRERGGTIRVVGHASSRTVNMDPVRHKLVNYDISSARAETVAKTLAEFGAKANGVVVVAKSDTDPLYYEFMPSGEAGNRRTEIYLDF